MTAYGMVMAKYASDEETENERIARRLRYARNVSSVVPALSGAGIALGYPVIPNVAAAAAPLGLAYGLHKLQKKYDNDKDFELSKLRMKDFAWSA